MQPRPPPDHPIAAQLLALQVMRRALAPDPAETGFWREVGAYWRHAHAQLLRHQRVGLVLAAEGTILLTRHEKRLLRAIAAAQRPDPALVDNFVFALAPGRLLRPVLTQAVERLAAGLTRHGHHLSPNPVAPEPIMREQCYAG